MSDKKLPNEIIEYSKAHKSTYKLIYKAIERYDNIVIFRHIRPDFDALGSQLGLVTFLKDNFPNKSIYYLGDNHVNFTGKLYPPSDTLPESWFKENKFLAIIIDVGESKRVADPRFKHAKYKIKIDHHPAIENIAKRCSLYDTDASSASELVGDVLLSWKGKILSKTCAEYLYQGIVGDSGRFLYSSTSSHTFAVANELLKCGVDLQSTYLKMYEKPINSLKVQGYILTHFNVSPYGVAYYVLDEATLKELNIATENGKDNVNLFSNIEGINAWASITQDSSPNDPCWRVSIRSKKVDVSGVANKWEGGGHAQAVGAKLKTLQDLPKMIADLDELFK